MSKPLTHAELLEALEKYATKGDLLGALEKYASKADLETWGGALWARIDALEGKVDGLYGELERHTRAILEAMSTQISVVDERYADLPGRVSRIERDATRSR